MKRPLQRGFTIVELIIVIVIIAILVLITATIYNSVQVQARDAKNADGADKIADALQLWIAKNGTWPKGGNGSTATLDTGTGTCPNGTNGYGWYSTGAYGASGCTFEDVLTFAGYLPSGFSAGLSPNVKYVASLVDGTRSVMVYRIGANDKAIIMYSMESPSAADTAHFNDELTKCYGGVPAAGTYAPRDTYKMANGICIEFKTF